MTENEISYQIRGAIFDIYNESVESLIPIHHKQVLTYLKVTNLKLGILVNFNANNITNSIHRKVNNL